MPVSYIPSAEQLIERQKTTARKRRRNQNVEIEELGALIPLTEGAGKQALDKISVLRLASSYMRFRAFVESAYGSTSGDGESSFSDLMSQAMDGFILVLDKEGEILFASEGITEYVGLSQQDVVGQNLFDITQTDDAKKIEDCLKPTGTKPNQFRQFYIRFKSTMSPGRIQLSRFTAHTMVQVSGHLKVRFPSVKEEDSKFTPKPEVLGLVAECRLIESSPSILEISIPQSSFTSTINLNLNIVSVDTRVKSVIGFGSDDVVGTAIDDYFHPADWAKVIPCYKILLRTGHGVSRVFRFMTNTGEWVWIQMEGLVRYKEGTKEPQFAEITCKVVSQCDKKLKFIEQKELYTVGKEQDPEQKAFMNIHRDKYFMDQLPEQPCPQSSEPIVEALKETKMSREAMDSVLHGRELAFQSLPDSVKYLAKREEVPDYERKIYEHYNGPFLGSSSTPSPPSSDQSSLSPLSSTSATSPDGSSPPPPPSVPVANGASQQYAVSTNETANVVPHGVVTSPDGMTASRISNPNSPEGGIVSVSSGRSGASPSSPDTLGSPTVQSVYSPPSQAPLSVDSGIGSVTSLFSPQQTPLAYPEQQGDTRYSPTIPATYPPMTANGVDVIPVLPFQVPQTHPVVGTVPQFYSPALNPFPEATMRTQPLHPAAHPRVNGGIGIDPELDRILWAMDTSNSGVNYSNGIPNGIPSGSNPVNSKPAYPQQAAAGSTITCTASASVFHPDLLANGHQNPPPGNEVQDILQQFL